MQAAHAHAAAILAALDALLVKHEDLQAIYDRDLKPHHISEQEWAMQMIQGQTEGGKKILLGEAALTVAAVTRLRESYDWSYTAAYMKLNRTVDENIARADRKFAEYLEEYGRLNKTGIAAEKVDYLTKQREAFWAKVRGQAHVVINDPTMQSCDLSAYGGGGAKAR